MLSQKNRIGAFFAPDTTSDGPTAGLVLLRFSGHEGVNALFEFEVECLSVTPGIDFEPMLGRNASVRLNAVSGAKRYFDGLVTEARSLGTHEGGAGYSLTLRPWLWLLGLRVNQRIFHNKTVPDILGEIFADYEGAWKSALVGSFPVQEYTVQYRETDLAFVQRMMSMAGISFYFEYALHGHTLVLVNEPQSLPEVPGGFRSYKVTDRQFRDNREHLRDWVAQRRMTTGRVALTDYNFKQPTQEMMTELEASAGYAHGKIESFVFPGGYPNENDGRDVAQLRLNQVTASDHYHTASGDCTELAAGMRVAVVGHPDEMVERQSFVAHSIAHSYTSDGYRSGVSAEGESYSARYEFRGADLPLVPPIGPAAPSVHGPQTAKVVGEGEIDCDKHGRILVRFHWDRHEANSMRCRVAQMAAGPKWGGIVIPRVDMEVVVEFIDGDPSKPLVVGTVYNGENEPPFDLPEKNMVAGIKTNSTPGGGGYNEIALDDSKGKEEFRVHAQRDMNTKVLRNETRQVNVNRTTSIGQDQVLNVARDEKNKFGRHRETEIQDNEKLKVGKERETDIGKNDTLKVGENLKIEAGKKIELIVGMSKITMEPDSIKIESLNIEIAATAQLKATGNAMAELSASGIVDIKGALVKINT